MRELDETLARRAITGNQQAIAELFVQEEAILFHTAYAYLKNEHDTLKVPIYPKELYTLLKIKEWPNSDRTYSPAKYPSIPFASFLYGAKSAH